MNFPYKSLRHIFFAFLCVGIPFLKAEQTLSSAPAVISFYEERDLELFHSCDHVRPGIFVSQLDKTYTIFGHKQLLNHLKNPVADVAVLQKRQKQLALFLEDQQLFDQVNSLLKDIQAHQEGLVGLFTEQDPLVKSTVDNFYFKHEWLAPYNNSALALDLRNYTKYLGLFGPVLEHVVLHLALEHVQQVFMGHGDHCDHDHGHHGHVCIDSLQAGEDSSALIKGGLFLLKAGHLGLHVASIKEMGDHIAAERTLVNQIHKKVFHAHSCLKSTQKLCQLLKERGYQAEAFGADAQALDFFDTTAHKDIINFVHDTAFESYGSEITFFNRIGSTLAYSRTLQQAAPVLEKLTEVLGDIDAVVSVAQWYKKVNVHAKRATFVEYVTQSNAPELCMQNLWHIALDHTKVTENSIELDQMHGRNIVITGPNKAGKSSILKAVGLNIILAQTYGVAAAQAVRITPFEKLISYIHVVDDITKDTSMMMAEVIRADNCMRTLRMLDHGQYACVLVDDSLFKGTTMQKSQELAEQFITAVGHTPQCCSVVATHMPVLTQLTHTHKGVFRNYCIDITIDERGKARSTFRLREGVANQQQVFDIIQSEIGA